MISRKILIVEDELIVASDIRLILIKAGYTVTGIAKSVDLALESIDKDIPDIVLLDIFLKGKRTGIDLAKLLNEQFIPFVYLSANSNQEVLDTAKLTNPSGFIVKPFRERDLLVTLDIAFYRHENSKDTLQRKEAEFKRQLVHLVEKHTGWEETLRKICIAIQPFIPFDFLGAGLKSTGGEPLPNNAVSFLRIGFDEYQTLGIKELMEISRLNMEDIRKLQENTPFPTKAIIYDETSFNELCAVPSMKSMIRDTFSLRSHLTIPSFLSDGSLFYFFFFSRRPNVYSRDHVELFSRLREVVVETIEHLLNIQKIAPLAYERSPHSLSQHNAFEGIIGKSHQLLNVFDQIQQVAPLNTSVLILGESGTGKERIAQCIHNLSSRASQPFVVVNCTTLPALLIESELFGHEKGSFTGAGERRIGKFEQANNGTVFLDEIGELPLELQIKFLRVLQEKQIERIGGRSPVKINVRIIAATNRNLEKNVAAGSFRLDLYYRLNIFPLTLPSLRDRKDDIELLATHFLTAFNETSGKKVTGISSGALSEMQSYNWPGNIRELENFMERHVLLAKSNLIENVFLPRVICTEQEELLVKSIQDNEKDYVLKILKKCNGRIFGAGGAAEILNMPPTTLASKIKKLGIKKDFQ